MAIGASMFAHRQPLDHVAPHAQRRVARRRGMRFVFVACALFALTGASWSDDLDNELVDALTGWVGDDKARIGVVTEVQLFAKSTFDVEYSTLQFLCSACLCLEELEIDKHALYHELVFTLHAKQYSRFTERCFNGGMTVYQACAFNNVKVSKLFASNVIDKIEFGAMLSQAPHMWSVAPALTLKLKKEIDSDPQLNINRVR